MGFDIKKIKHFLQNDACDAENIIEIEGVDGGKEASLVIQLAKVKHGNYILTELQETYNCHLEFENNRLILRELKEDNDIISNTEIPPHAIMSDTDDEDEGDIENESHKDSHSRVYKRRARAPNSHEIVKPSSANVNSVLYALIIILILALAVLATFMTRD